MTATDIARAAYAAGFRGLGLVNAIAVALAESGGEPNAHNTSGEDSRGLWQINVQAHPEYANVNLFDPAENAKAAYAISSGGTSWSAWTTFTQGTINQFLENARAAATAVLGSGAPPITMTPGDGGNRTIDTPIGKITVPGITVPGVSVPNPGDIPGSIAAAGQGFANGITNAGQGIVNSIQQITSSITSPIANLTSFLKFLGDPKSWTAFWLIVTGLGITILGIILFAVSLIPGGTVKSVERIATAAA